MSGIESLFFKSVETPSETELAKTELVNQTEVSNFELSSLVSNENIADYIRETIPQSHLENCAAIHYEPQANEQYPFALGTFDRSNREICIWGDENFNGSRDVLSTLTHEIGHNAHENIMDKQPELAEKWSQLHEQSFDKYQQEGLGFVSSYAQTNVYEDFADSYAAYLRDPEKLQFYSPEKYEFMQNNIFSGEEYPPRLVGGYYLGTEGSYHWSPLDENGEPTILFDYYDDYYYTTCGP